MVFICGDGKEMERKGMGVCEVCIPKRSGTENQALDIQSFHQYSHAPVQLPEHVLSRYENVFEDQFARVRPPHPELVELARAGESRGRAIDDEGRDAFATLVGLCFGIDDDVVGVWSLSLNSR